jgi:ABC-2 type transport system ATP-binding protein
MEQNLLIQATNLAKKFEGRYAIKDVSMTVQKGEILGFLGPSGAGKTTNIKILTGQLRQTEGTALLLGKDSRKLDESIYKKIGIVTDNSGVYKKLTVYDNLKCFANILEVDHGMIDELLQRVGLEEHKKKKAEKLSKGQMQRLVLARAILHRPALLMLDEPTSGLDPTTALSIHELLQVLKNSGMGILLTTHNMEEATKLCDHVALLNEGEIVEYGTPKEICLKYNQDRKYEILLKNGQKYILDETDEALAMIQDWMKEHMIETLHTCEPTLEQVFITITGRALIC